MWTSVLLGRRPTGLERDAGSFWTVWGVRHWDVVAAEAVVLATPAPATANLLRHHDDEAAVLLDAIDYASVVLADLPCRRG